VDKYSDHLFSDAARAHQHAVGMRDRYEKMYENRFRDGLDEDAKAFVESRKTFYMASVVDNGWPYVQHRGGPAGFLQVLDPPALR